MIFFNNFGFNLTLYILAQYDYCYDSGISIKGSYRLHIPNAGTFHFCTASELKVLFGHIKERVAEDFMPHNALSVIEETYRFLDINFKQRITSSVHGGECAELA